MASRIVRLYQSPLENADVLGFSLSAASATDDPRFARFLDERGYSWDVMRLNILQAVDDAVRARLPEGGVSYSYVEVRPPLSEEHIKQFGRLCVGGSDEVGIVDPYHNNIFVFDNRAEPPSGPMDPGFVIASYP